MFNYNMQKWNVYSSNFNVYILINSMNFFENEYTERFFKTDFQNRRHSEGAIMD